ncbi:hypothetical protein BDW22DRAFT_1356551 [Trametopsis cervina]|nr:hypothetical protein BDW22DRAFT_1356551 [Trametopsis cervina]
MPLYTNDRPSAATGDEHVKDAPHYVRHSDLWFVDGSVVLQAEQTRFRVHMSVLSRRSLFFHDMFSLPQPPSQPSTSSDTSTVDGCPLVILHDSAHDLANLLIAFYDGPTFGDNDPDDFRVVSGILRLATKYTVDSLREEALAHLHVAWPIALKAWDTREEVASMYEAETAAQHGQRYPSPIDVINLAREINAPSLLPVAFYDLSRYHFSQIFETPEDALRGLSGSASLSLQDMQCLVLGKESSQQFVSSLIQSMGSISHRDYPGHQSRRGGPVNTHRRKVSCTSAMACRKEFSELVTLATQHYLFDREKGCADPLYVAEELGQLKSAEFSECEACARALELWATKERQRIWKLLPTWFRLDA